VLSHSRLKNSAVDLTHNFHKQARQPLSRRLTSRSQRENGPIPSNRRGNGLRPCVCTHTGITLLQRALLSEENYSNAPCQPFLELKSTAHILPPRCLWRVHYSAFGTRPFCHNPNPYFWFCTCTAMQM